MHGELRHSLFSMLPFGMRAAEIAANNLSHETVGSLCLGPLVLDEDSEGFNGQLTLDEDSWMPFNDWM